MEKIISAYLSKICTNLSKQGVSSQTSSLLKDETNGNPEKERNLVIPLLEHWMVYKLRK